MSSHLELLFELSVTPVHHEQSSNLYIHVSVLPSTVMELGGVLPSLSTHYPVLHLTVEYPFEDTAPALRLSPPTRTRPYWYHTFQMIVASHPECQILKVRLWRDAFRLRRCIGYREWEVPPNRNVRSAGELSPFVKQKADGVLVTIERQH